MKKLTEAPELAPTEILIVFGRKGREGSQEGHLSSKKTTFGAPPTGLTFKRGGTGKLGYSSTLQTGREESSTKEEEPGTFREGRAESTTNFPT